MARASKTPQEFAAEAGASAPTVELLGTYVNARTKVACRCRTCGHEWEASPNHLLRGTGCPECAGTRKRSDADFTTHMAELHPDIEVLGTYVNARTRVACRCKECGHTWEPEPRGLMQGNGCPVCAARKAASRLRASHQEDTSGKVEGSKCPEGRDR